jgi:hypothetical protein
MFAALLGELERLRHDRVRTVEDRAGDRRARELVGSARLEILAADLARDLERLRVPALVVVEVAEPPADSCARREALDPSSGFAVVEEDEGLLDELAAARQVGVAQAARSRRARSGRAPGGGRRRPRRVGEDALHLDRLRRQVGEAARGPGGEEAALQRRLELDRATSRRRADWFASRASARRPAFSSAPAARSLSSSGASPSSSSSRVAA